MNKASIHSPKAGFTLVEVSLAVLVVGLGLLTLFGLFPSGLRAGEEAAADTRAGLFASAVFEGMHANAADVRLWADWEDGEPAVGAALNSTFCNLLLDTGTITADGDQQPKIEFPKDSGQYLRYSLKILRRTTRSCSAYLRVWERTGITYSEFYTEFLYGGR